MKSLIFLFLSVLTFTLGDSVQGDYNCSDTLGKCYKLYSTLSSWSLARNTCSQDGAKLVIIRNKMEEQFITSTFQDDNDFPAYTGAHIIFEKENPWEFLDENYEKMEYANWSLGEPESGYYCVRINLQTSKIASTNCQLPRPFICERPANSTKSLATSLPPIPTLPPTLKLPSLRAILALYDNEQNPTRTINLNVNTKN